MKAITRRRKRLRRTVAGILLLLLSLVFISDSRSALPIDREAILQHLNAAISWYRDSTSKIQSVGMPSDAIYQDTAQNLAQQAVRLAFQSAQAGALLMSAPPEQATAAPAPATPSGSGQQQNFAQTLATLKARISDNQAKIDALNKQIERAAPSKRQSLSAQRDALQGEVELDQATADAIQKLATFVESSNDSGGFAGSINDLAKTVPEVLGDANAQKAAAKPEVAKPTVSKSSGLLGQGLTLYSEIRTVHQIDQMANETEQVREIAAALRQPMRDALGSIVQRGRNLAGQTPPSDPAQAKAAQQELRTLTDQFKQLANVVIPLSQELVVLDQSRSNFINWRNSLARESKDTLRSVVLSALGIFLALGALWVLSEVWRRWTFRYIHDLRRRRQFQLLRRFVMGFLIAVVLTLGVVSDFQFLGHVCRVRDRRNSCGPTGSASFCSGLLFCNWALRNQDWRPHQRRRGDRRRN